MLWSTVQSGLRPEGHGDPSANCSAATCTPTRDDVRLNKATAHSWLCFSARDISHGGNASNWDELVHHVETSRSALKRAEASPGEWNSEDGRLLDIFNDRATARVNDVSSVLLRDMVIWVVYASQFSGTEFELAADLALEARRLQSSPDLERGLLRFAETAGWGTLR